MLIVQAVCHCSTMSVAVLDDVSTIASAPVSTVSKPRDYSYLKAYQFKQGQKPPAKAGRPKGSKNAVTMLHEAAPKIAKHFIKRSFQSDKVLISAMDRIIPVEKSSPNVGPQVVIFAGEHGVLPRHFVEADIQPVVFQTNSHENEKGLESVSDASLDEHA